VDEQIGEGDEDDDAFMDVVEALDRESQSDGDEPQSDPDESD
jgi:hypothetical protein